MKRILSLLLLLCLPAFARQDVSLNGAWQMVKTASLDTAPPQAGWADFQVPGTIGGFRGEFAWLKRTFPVPQNWSGQRIKLKFGGVKWNSKIFVNGKFVGGKLNGYDAFELDITDAMQFGADNELRIGVQDWTATFSSGEPIDLSQAGNSFAARSVPKNRVISPFGGQNGNYGIWDDVILSALPPLHVERTFIQPSVRRNNLQVDVWLFNSAASEFNGTIQARIVNYQGGTRDNAGQWPAGGAEVTSKFKAFDADKANLTQVAQIPAISSATIAFDGQHRYKYTLLFENPPLEQWTPQNPKLYLLEIKIGDDVYRERFGYREFWTQGGDFYLNGAKTHLLATSWWPNANAPLDRATVASQLKAIRAANTFVFRTHTQPWPERWYEMADEIGVMMIPEGALWCDPQVYAVGDEAFWKNYGEHLVAMATHLRNHASIVMYSLENEMGHCGGRSNPKMEEGFARMAKLIKFADPTRPITFEADGDPGGQTDVIGIHYPNEYPQKRLWPNDAYWLDKPRTLSLFGPQPWQWKHNKPIYIGEYLWVYQNATPAAHTIFFGDEAYRNHQLYSARAKAEAWKMQMQAYRAQDVSGQSPWTMNENGPLDATNPTYLAHKDKFRPLAAFIKEYDSRFWAGETVTRTVQLFNDTPKDEPLLRLAWSMSADGKEVVSGSRVVNLPAGGIKEETIQIKMPSARYALPLGLAHGGRAPRDFSTWKPPSKTSTLHLSLIVNGQERFHDERPVTICSRPLRWNLPTNFALFDPQGTLKKAWSPNVWTPAGNTIKILNKLDDWDGKGLLVIGPAPVGKKIETDVGAAELQPLAQQNAEGNRTAQTQIIGGVTGGQNLAAKVKNGGRVLVLEQNAADWLPVRLSDRNSTMSFAQLPEHPALRSLADSNLHWWRGDNLVSRNEPLREAQAGMAPIIVTGGEAGISHAPLLEIGYGKGVWLICQMQAVSKMDSEPAARQLLENALGYLASYQALQGDISLFGSVALGEKLTRLGLDWTPLTDWKTLRFPAKRALVLQADGATVAQNAAVLKIFMQAGGQVLWHRPQEANFTEAANALGVQAQRQNYRGPALRADQIPAPFQLLTREDLYWTGAPGSVAWDATSLANDTAEAIFDEAPKELSGTTYQAENAPILDGKLVRIDGTEVGFFTSGSATWPVLIPADGRYAVSVYARGTALGGVFPQVSVTLDGQPVGNINLSQKELRFYNVAFAAKSGAHTLKMEFVNDQGDDKEDRNLWIDRFVIGAQTQNSAVQNLTNPAALVRYPVGQGALILSAIRWDEAGGNTGKANHFAASLLTALGGRSAGPGKGSRIEPEKMNPMPNLPWFRREADHVYMGAGGYIEGPIRIEKAGRYRVDVWGKGTKGAGVYPIVVLELGGAEIGRLEIKSDEWAPHSLDVQLPAGEKMLRLRFINDDAPQPEDRNLWLERLEFTAAD